VTRPIRMMRARWPAGRLLRMEPRQHNEPGHPPRPARRGGLRSYAAAGLAATGLALAISGCGESKEEKAEKKVCAARSEIASNVNTLQSLPLAPASLEKAKTGVTAIGEELKKINEAAKDLAPSRKQEVETATSEFSKQASKALEGFNQTGSLLSAEAALRGALQGLGTAYKTALEPVKCS
jgi:hypothetical protein